MLFPTRIELGSHEGEADEDHKLDGLAYTLIHTIDGKSNIVEGDLEPSKPYYRKEANIGHERSQINDRMHGRKGC